MKISFDFDDTLSLEAMQNVAKGFIDQGHTVWITTSRPMRGADTKLVHSDLFKISDSLGISHQVQFTNYEDKYQFLRGFHLHFDNDEAQINLINASPVGCVGVLYKPNFFKPKLR